MLEPIVKISKSIDEGVKAFEEQERLKRAKTIEELFQKAIASTGKDIDIRLFSKYFDEFSKKRALWLTIFALIKPLSIWSLAW